MEDRNKVPPLFGLAVALLSFVLVVAGAVVNTALLDRLGATSPAAPQHAPSAIDDNVPVNV